MADFHTPTLRMDERPDGIALLGLDVPNYSINVLNRQVLVDLDAAFDHVAAQRSIRVLVIRSNKLAGFIAGADLNELAAITSSDEARALSEMGQKLFSKLADLPIPTIGLIHGPCLGGGLELALACDYRILLDQAKTQLGLPEVELGLLPAWGGTQRLPRIVGLERALQVILGGRRLTAQEALRWGLADVIGATEKDLGIRLGLFTVRALAEGKRPLRSLPLRSMRQRLLESTPLTRLMLFRAVERKLRQRVPEDMPAPAEALNVVREGLSKGLQTGLMLEREAVGRLALTSACRNLIDLFLKREAARKLPASVAEAPPPEVRRVGVVGAGTMGAGIVQLAALRGFEVCVHEVNETALAAGTARIAELFRKAAQKGVLSNQAAERKLAAIKTSTKWEGFANVDLVVEAVLEDLKTKQRVFAELEARTRPTAILATNTSSLLIQQIQQGLCHPERVAGLHFFNPVHKIPLVEVVGGPATSKPTAAALLQWASTLGKTPVLVQDGPGFVVNRTLMPYLTEAVVLVTEGMKITAIDQAMRRFGMPMGPLELLDQVGLDVAVHIAYAMQPAHKARPGMSATSDLLIHTFEQMSQKGWLGQKTGCGFYRYRGKARKPNAAMARQLSASVGNNYLRSMPPTVQAREAQQRMVLPMVNEAAACLAEGKATDASSIDLAMVLGTGWAPHRGGPLRYGEERGFGSVVNVLEELARRVSPRFEPCRALRDYAKGPSLG